MAVIKVEEFRGDHNKLYLTVPRSLKNYGELYVAAKKRFKVANNNIIISKGWIIRDKIVGDTLFVSETPHRPRFVSGSVNVTPVWAAYANYIRRS
jgi:hypothetical protein